MKKGLSLQMWQQFGRLAFWGSWPLLWFYLRSGWRTRVVVVADGKVLMVKSWLGDDQWGLPGGGLHNGEAAVAGALRELREETNLKLKPDQLQFMYKDRTSHHGLSFNYHCYGVNLAKIQPVSRQKYEITNLAWIPLAEVLAGRSTGETLKAVAAWTKHQSLLK